MSGMRQTRKFTSAVAVASALASASIAQGPHYRFDLAPQELKFALRTVTREAGLQLFAGADDLQALRAPSLHADLTVDEALRQLLAGSGLHAEFQGKAVFIRGRSSPDAGQPRTSKATDNDIVVTGTRIRGGHPASPVIFLSREQMLDAGETNLGDAVRNIPQAFGGGQNPNVLYSTGSGQGNGNLNAASTINLRGLGPDATLTLINGHRISYDGASQAVDISAIPVAAIERLEIVADGASALYGSDAVGGVANIILRRDFDGLETDVRLGGATDGGDFQQQYDVVTGRKWSSGGFILTYDFQRSTAVNAGQRSITSDLNATTTLFPYLRQHSVILSGHQSLGSDFDLALDATFDRRSSANNLAYSLSEPAEVYGIVRDQSTTGMSIAPRLEWHALHAWLIALSGVYGWDKADYRTITVSGGTLPSGTQGHYINDNKSAELTGEGPLFALPAGSARLAIGAGYRDVGLLDRGAQLSGSASRLLIDTKNNRASTYGYGELFLPLVEPTLGIAGVERLEVAAAVRYESYNGIGSVATPKIGLIYSPVSDLTLRATWGRSISSRREQPARRLDHSLFERKQRAPQTREGHELDRRGKVAAALDSRSQP
jgi:outer membrane receptor protein involved in Fe transport